MKLIYEGSWSTYEEWCGVQIFEDEHGALWQKNGGYSVMGDPNDPEWEETLWPISYEDAMELIDEYDRLTEENDKEMAGSNLI